MYNVACILQISADSALYFHQQWCKLSCSIVIVGLNVYTDSVEEDKMLAEGVSRFCDDASLDPTSLTVLILAWKFKAATQCEFTRKEFVEGMAELG